MLGCENGGPCPLMEGVCYLEEYCNGRRTQAEGGTLNDEAELAGAWELFGEGCPQRETLAQNFTQELADSQRVLRELNKLHYNFSERKPQAT